MKNHYNKIFSNIIKIFVIIIFFVVIYNYITLFNIPKTKIIFSEFLDRINHGYIKEVIIRGTIIEGKLSNGSIFLTYLPKIYPQLIDDLRIKNIKINILPTDSIISNISNFFFSWLPIIILLFAWFYYLKNIQNNGNKAISFGKSRAIFSFKDNKRITFDNIAGIDEVKDDLKEIVSFLKNPTNFSKLGGKIPKGCLLIGSPGTGKTLLAKALAGEANVPFFSISGSDFVEMFVGVGASRVRDMFNKAKKFSPCIIFIDEIDAVGRHRGSGYGGGNDEREQTLNQLLVEMDGFVDNNGIIVIASTNRPDVLDSAILRPGRFDRKIHIPIPDIKGRKDILNVHLKKVLISPTLDINLIARGTSGFVGADLSNLVNEAALAAIKFEKDFITIDEFNYARDKILMGPHRKSILVLKHEKKITSYHESGHALVSLFLFYTDPIHKVTIVPRGKSLGMVMQLPELDTCHYNKTYLQNRVSIAMGGRVAEEIILGFNNITTGASNDIKVATDIAVNMIKKWGLGCFGPIYLSESSSDKNYYNLLSAKKTREFEDEIYKLIYENYIISRFIILKHRKKFDIIAKALLYFETIHGPELSILLNSDIIYFN